MGVPFQVSGPWKGTALKKTKLVVHSISIVINVLQVVKSVEVVAYVIIFNIILLLQG